MPYQELTSANILLPRAISPIGNPTWVTIKAPVTLPTGATAGNNWTVTFTQDDLVQTWQENDAFILDGVRFEAHVVPTKPTHFVCEATGTTGMDVAMRGLVKAINNHYRFANRYYASTYQDTTDKWILQVLSLRPGGVFDLDYSLERIVSGVVGANDIFTTPYNELSGQGPTLGEDLDGYGTFINVWAQQTWQYGDGNTAFTPGIDATPLVKLRQNYQPGGEYEFDVSAITADLLPDWLPELGFVPVIYPDGGGTSLGMAGALRAYFVEAGQFYRNDGQFRGENVEYTSGPLFAWRGAIKALNPTDQEHKRVTGVGLPAARQQQVLSSLVSSVGRDPMLGDQPAVIVVPRSQDVQYLSFLHTRIELLSPFPQYRWVKLMATYTFFVPDAGVTLRVPDVIVYGSAGVIANDSSVDPADVYYARIDWSKISNSVETVLHEYYDSNTTEEDYPLVKAEFYFVAAENSIDDKRLTEAVTVYYPKDDCQDDYQVTLAFRNHWGTYECVQMRAGFTSETTRTAQEWERATGRKTTFKDLVQFSLVQNSQTSFTTTSKPLTALESAWLRELVASDRVFLYHYGPDFTINNQAPTPPSTEMWLPLVVTDAKLKYDTEQAGNVLQLSMRLSNTEKAWQSPNTDAQRIKLSQNTGGGQYTGGGSDTGGLELGDEEPLLD